MEQALYVDLMLAVLATRILWISSWELAIAALLLYVSLHAVYEIGYFENDFKATNLEAKPKVAEGAEMVRGFLVRAPRLDMGQRPSVFLDAPP